MNKRQRLMLVLLPALLGGLGFFAYLRLDGATVPDLSAVAAAAEVAEREADGEGGEATDTTEVAGTDTPVPPGVDGGPPVDAGAPVELTQLRVVGLGADSLAPGILANGGREGGPESRFTAAGLSATFRASDDASAVERALALGGDAEDGAHLIVLPLPTFVASYERLKALDPRIVGVAAWSSGRDAFYGPSRDSLAERRRGNVRLCGPRSGPATFLSLYLLELSGTGLDAITVAENNCVSEYLSVDRGGSTEGNASRLVATTADASTLIPWVFVAPEAMVEGEAERGVLARWMKVWFEGVSTLRSDVPGGARTIAGETSADPVSLLQRLGQVEIADLAQNAAAFGLSGRDSVTIGSLFGETWRVWRTTGVLATPAPESVPLDTRVVAAAVRASSARPEAPSRSAPSFDTHVLLSHRLSAEERADVVHRIGWLAGLFPRSGIELRSSQNEGRRNAIVQEARARFGLSEERVRARRGRQDTLVVYAVQ